MKSRGDFSMIGDMHVLSSALKACMTMIACEGMDTCRRAVGGHGYLMSAGIALQYISYVPQTTYEGDFVVLSIQAGRKFLKMAHKGMAGSSSKKPANSNSPQKYIEEYFNSAAFQEKQDRPIVARDVQSLLSNGMGPMVEAFQKR